jgi:glycosyltransferase involved in cell wall biosynthesis
MGLSLSWVGWRRLFRPKPALTVVVVAYNMQREIVRTLQTLDPCYQQGVGRSDYEVIVVDNGSTEPLSLCSLGVQFSGHLRVLRMNSSSVSPVAAVNAGVAEASARRVVVMVDGARMISPGMLRGFLDAFRLYSNAFVYTLGWHLGDEPQNTSMVKGYNQVEEDRLLASFNWRANGYSLFSHACLALSSRRGWFSEISESNCFAGGFDPRFQSPGGGLVNLDFFRLAISCKQLQPMLLLGEGSFHQFHGGVATNVRPEQHPWQQFDAEYQSIRGAPFKQQAFAPIYFGKLSQEARRFLIQKL